MTKKIGYSKTYPILNLGVWEKIWEEQEVPIEADSRQIWYEMKKKVESFHYESNKADEKKAEIKVISETKKDEPKEPTLEDQIHSCKELKVLEGYRLIVKGVPTLQKLYDKKLAELK